MQWQLLLACLVVLIDVDAAPFGSKRTDKTPKTAQNPKASVTTEEITTTEDAFSNTTTEESTTTEETTTTTTTPAAPFGDLVIVEKKDKDGNAMNKIDGEVKLNGKRFGVQCHCADFTTTSPAPVVTSCPNYREYKITKIHPALLQKGGAVLSQDDVLNMLPQGADIEFVPVRSTTLSDMDHRDQGAIMAGNGGDAAEFVIALQAYQYLSRGHLNEQTVEQLLLKYLKRTAPRQFFFRTSKDAVQHLNQELGHFIALDGNPRAGDQAALLGANCPVGKQCGLMSAGGNGDVVLKGMLSSHGKYFVNQTIVRHFIKAFFKRKWSNPTDTQLIVDATKLEDQFRHQKGVVLLKTNAACHKEGTAPILRLPLQQKDSPREGGLYVYQHDAVNMRREELAHFFAGHLSTIRPDLTSQHATAMMKLLCESLGNRALEQTLRTIAKGLPLFGVELVISDKSEASKLKRFPTTVAPSNTTTSGKEVGIGDFLNQM